MNHNELKNRIAAIHALKVLAESRGDEISAANYANVIRELAKSLQIGEAS